MRIPWSRAGAILGLLVAIFSDLTRRAWWAYRRGGLHAAPPRVTLVARRPAQRHTYVPQVTANWRPVAARALPIQAVATVIRDAHEPLPIVWIDVRDRPDIADLPRVLRSSRAAGGPPLVGTQWLADADRHQTVLVVTVVEPVSATWALSFDIPRHIRLLERIASAGEFFIAWNEPPSPREAEDDDLGPVLATLPAEGVLLSVDRPAQLYAILAMWADRHEVA